MTHMNEPTLKVGIVGAGVVTSGSHLPVLVNMPGIHIEWVCDRSLATARAVAQSYKIGQVFTHISECPDVDVVLVATPVGSRKEVVPEVLARGWHAFCEKPFAASLAEHDAYLDAAARQGVQIGVGQVRRYSKPTLTARRLLRLGFLGPVLRVAAAEGSHQRGTGRGSGWHMTDPSAGGGVLMETGSHLVDQVFYILGETDVSLRECIQRTHMGLELATSLVADLNLADGTTVDCSIEVSMVEDLCNGVFVEFPNFVLRAGLYFGEPLTLITREGETLCELGMDDGADTPVQGFFLEWRDFLEQCRTGEPSAVDAASVRNTTALIEACYRRVQGADRVLSR
jgi:predicted dehydrogenase